MHALSRWCFSLAALLSATSLLAQTPSFRFLEKPGPYPVGLKVVNQYDHSRTFPSSSKGSENSSTKDAGRPLQTLIWYPAQQKVGDTMTVGDYVALAATQFRFEAPDLQNRWATSLLSASSNVRLWAIRDATPETGRFPVVIYSPGQSSVAWDNADLCEYLASHGYVVVASPSMGAMTFDSDDNLPDVNAQALTSGGGVLAFDVGSQITQAGSVSVDMFDLQGGTWTLNAATGSWNLLGGGVRNGTVSESGGALLVATSSGGTLTNVAVNGDLDLTRQANASVRVYGGLPLNGTLSLGDAAGSTYGRIYFGDGGSPAGALTGTGTVVFGGTTNNYFENSSNLGGAAGTLTLGPGITVRGKSGYLYNASAGGTLVNAAEALLKAGATEVSAYITHGVLSEGAAERVAASKLKELVITDSIAETDAVKKASNIRVISIAPLMGEAIARTASEQSVSSLLD